MLTLLSPSTQARWDGKTLTVLPLKDRFEIARERVRHEDSLVHNRIGWFLTFQGLLFTAFFAGLELLTGSPPSRQSLLVIAVLLLVAVGAVSALAGFFAVRAALMESRRIPSWWELQAGGSVEFPAVVGRGGFSIEPNRLLKPECKITVAHFRCKHGSPLARSWHSAHLCGVHAGPTH